MEHLRRPFGEEGLRRGAGEDFSQLFGIRDRDQPPELREVVPVLELAVFEHGGEQGARVAAPLAARLVGPLRDERARELLHVVGFSISEKRSQRAERSSKGFRITSPRAGSWKRSRKPPSGSAMIARSPRMSAVRRTSRMAVDFPDPVVPISFSPPRSEIRSACCSAIVFKLAAVSSKINERIEALEYRLKQLKARQARIEARRRSLESRRARRDDTRRKILVGAIVLAKVDQGALEETMLRRWLDGALTRADDRQLFGLGRPRA